MGEAANVSQIPIKSFGWWGSIPERLLTDQRLGHAAVRLGVWLAMRQDGCLAAMAGLSVEQQKMLLDEFSGQTKPGTILNREQIAQHLGWKGSAVCGRVNSRVTKGCLIEAGTAKTSTGHTAKLVKLPVVQGSLFT